MCHFCQTSLKSACYIVPRGRLEIVLASTFYLLYLQVTYKDLKTSLWLTTEWDDFASVTKLMTNLTYQRIILKDNEKMGKGHGKD